MHNSDNSILWIVHTSCIQSKDTEKNSSINQKVTLFLHSLHWILNLVSFKMHFNVMHVIEGWKLYNTKAKFVIRSKSCLFAKKWITTFESGLECCCDLYWNFSWFHKPEHWAGYPTNFNCILYAFKNVHNRFVLILVVCVWQYFWRTYILHPILVFIALNCMRRQNFSLNLTDDN